MPTISQPNTYSFQEDAGSSLLNGLTISDTDPGAQIRVKLTLSNSAVGGLSAGDGPASILEFTDTAAALKHPIRGHVRQHAELER
jgi:hypothetical protein